VRTATRPNPARNGWASRRERMAAEAEAEAAGAIVAEDGEAVTEES